MAVQSELMEAVDQAADKKISRSAEKNSELNLSFSEGLDKATRLTLWEIINSKTGDYPDIQPEPKGKFANEVFRFVKNTLKYRCHPEIRNVKQYNRKASFAERVSGFLMNNIDEEYSNIRKFDNFVCVDKYIFTEEGVPIRRVELHYGATETKADNSFIDEVASDPEKFLREQLGIEKASGQNLDLYFEFHLPKDATEEEAKALRIKVTEMSQKWMEKILPKLMLGGDTSHIGIEVEIKRMPINADTFKILDQNIDHFKRKETVGRHPTEEYMEIRKQTVEKTIKRIEAVLPENSNLKRLIKSDLNGFVDIVYKNIRTYYRTDSDWLGYIFEAAVALELSSNSELSRSINNVVGVTQRQNGELLDLSSKEHQALCENYSSRQEKLSLQHADGVITIEDNSIGNNGRRIIGLYECKASVGTTLSEKIKGQIYKQVKNLKEYIEYYNKFHEDQLSTIPENLVNVVLIKPTSEKPEPALVTPIKGRMVTLLRSSVTSADMSAVWLELNKKEDDGEGVGEEKMAVVDDEPI